MKIISGFFVYRVYITYKSHFSSSDADISKYNYNLFNVSYDAFLSTKGVHYYDKIAKRIQKEKEVVNLFISAFIDNPNTWIGDIFLNLSHYINLKEERENRLSNLSYLFKKDCINMIAKGLLFNNELGNFVFNEFTQANIELETFIIFKKIFNFSLDNNIEYDYIYRVKYEKYEFLLNINTEKYKLLLKEAIMSFRD